MISVALAFSLVAGPAVTTAGVADPRIQRWADATPDHCVVSTVIERADRLGIAAALASGMALTSRSVTLAGAPDLEVVRILGSFGSSALSRDVARVVRRASTGELLLAMAPGPVPAAAFTATRGLAVSEAHARNLVAATGAGGSQGRAAVDLVAVPGHERTRLLWRVDPPVDPVTLANPVFVVDSATGAVDVEHDRSRRANVRAFERNPVLDPMPGDFLLNRIDEPAATLVGPYFRALNCTTPTMGSACQPAHIARADIAGDFLFDPPALDDVVRLEDEFAEVSAYYHADKFHAWLLGLGITGTTCHAAGQTATLVANYRVYSGTVPLAVDNATYTGDCSLLVVLGQGKDVDWSYDGDIVDHEISHGIVDQQIGAGNRLGGAHARTHAVSDDAGAINEAIADYLASAFMGDPIHGDYVAGLGPGQGRDASNDFTCPHSMIGEIHFDSEVFTGALWELHDLLGEPFVPVVVDAITMFPHDASFEEAAEVIGAIAQAELGTDAGDTVRGVMTDRGLLDCPRIAPWAERERDRLWLYPKSLQGKFDPIRPPPVQFEIVVPEDRDTAVVTWRLEVFPPPMWEPIAEIEVLVKRDEPIVFDYQPVDDTLVVDADSDEHLFDLDDNSVEIAAAPGQTLYLAFFNRGLHTAELTSWGLQFLGDGEADSTETGTSGEPSTAGTTGTDGTTEGDGAAADDDGSSGCGCRPGPPATAPLVLVMILARRRRSHGVP